ncbi:MAG: lipoyl(octanoyl) transferase LipB [Spirochaetales bacterium]|nr:lipoyl(octanoyl) transferase LipB [Leptospiraceae bacterium]MCP5483612.1 lipoyl(octanoyl) transferase LipB [Spirochaetales bacterium]MCP5484523.1 lipoyl(octanoyl) transferase LipB [Spirochaetales bacterium]
MRTVDISGLRPAWRYQEYLALADKLRSRRREVLLFCEHAPTITAGLQSRPGSLLVSREHLRQIGVELQNVRRGGDLTAHEPGQLVTYAHIDLTRRAIPLRSLAPLLLEVTMRSLKEVWNLETQTATDAPGLYLPDGRKLVSIGLQVRRGFSSDGLALNVTNSLKTFQFIHPCGFSGLRMVSLSQLGLDCTRVALYKQQWDELVREHLGDWPGSLD